MRLARTRDTTVNDQEIRNMITGQNKNNLRNNKKEMSMDYFSKAKQLGTRYLIVYNLLITTARSKRKRNELTSKI